MTRPKWKEDFEKRALKKSATDVCPNSIFKAWDVLSMYYVFRIMTMTLANMQSVLMHVGKKICFVDTNGEDSMT